MSRRNSKMKRSCLLLFLMLLCSQVFCYTFEELKKLPYKQTAFYGGSFSSELLYKVRDFEGNAKSFLSDFDNCYEYKNHVLTDAEKFFLRSTSPVSLRSLKPAFWNMSMPCILLKGCAMAD